MGELSDYQYLKWLLSDEISLENHTVVQILVSLSTVLPANRQKSIGVDLLKAITYFHWNPECSGWDEVCAQVYQFYHDRKNAEWEAERRARRRRRRSESETESE